MSYSFTVQGANKADLRERAAVKFDEVIASQAVHAADKTAALANLDGALAVLPDAVEGRQLTATLGGYLSWTQATSAPSEFNGVSVSVNAAWFVPQPTA